MLTVDLFLLFEAQTLLSKQRDSAFGIALFFRRIAAL
jgi:hypothetical protein